MRDGGKGDKQRPLGVSEEQFNNNWDAIFKKNHEKVKATVYGVEIEKTQEQWDAIFNEPKEKKESPIELDLEASNDELKASINLKIPF